MCDNGPDAGVPVPPPQPLIVPLSAVALSFATLLLVAWRLVPPASQPADAPPDRFSSARALRALARLQPRPGPHPVGSSESGAFRQRLVTELETLGLKPSLQQKFECGQYGVCAKVTNVVAELGGSTDRAIALMAHYDSVPAGPGAADDGSGVASLVEIARAIQATPPLRHSVLLVFTDGEEVGMLGSRLFAREHPAAHRIDTVINLEARGVRGPSTLFRTSPDATRLLASFDVPRPVASSLAQEVFAQLPNETDLSQLLAVGISGYDLAFLGGAQAYHTPLDSPANLNPRSVQHQGSNALALVRAVDTLDATDKRGEPAVYFDLLAWTVIAWPASRAVPLAGTVLGLLMGALVALGWRHRVTALGVGLGLALWLTVVVLVGVAAFASHLVLRWVGALAFVWIAFPGVWHAFIGALAVAATLFGARLAHRLGRGELALGALLGWSLLAMVSAQWFPGASYLFFVPSCLGALVAVSWACLPGDSGADWLELVPLAIAGLVWWPIAIQLYAAIGFAAMPANALVVSCAMWFAAPALSRLDAPWLSRGGLLSAGTSAAALTVASVVPPATPTKPNWTNLAYHQHEADPPQWLLDASFGAPPAGLLAVAPFVPTSSYVWPGAPGAALAASAEGPALTPPEIEVRRRTTTSSTREIIFHARSRRGAPALSLHSPANRPVTVRIGGRHATPIRIGGHRVFVCLGVPDKGIEFEVSVIGDEPWTGLVVDHVPGLPESGEFLVQARGRTATLAHFGDATIASTALSL